MIQHLAGALRRCCRPLDVNEDCAQDAFLILWALPGMLPGCTVGILLMRFGRLAAQHWRRRDGARAGFFGNSDRMSRRRTIARNGLLRVLQEPDGDPDRPALLELLALIRRYRPSESDPEGAEHFTPEHWLAFLSATVTILYGRPPGPALTPEQRVQRHRMWQRLRELLDQDDLSKEDFHD